MPPKSSSAVLPTRRTPRTTAKKANPNPNPTPTPKTSVKSTTKSPPASASGDSVGGAKPTTTSPSPPVPSLTSPSSNKLGTAGDAKTITTTLSPPVPSLSSPSSNKSTPLASPQTPANVLNLNPKSTSGEGVTKGNQKPKSSPQIAVTEMKLNPKSTSATEVVSVDPQSVPVSSQSKSVKGDAGIKGEIRADETLNEKVTAATAVAVEAKSIVESGVETAPVGAKKTVMKKRVRVVKKVVKKKVPKRVLKEQIASSIEESQNVESSKDGEMHNPPVTFNDMEVKCPVPIESVSMEVESPVPVESVSMEVEKQNPIDAISPEIETLKTNVVVPMDSEKSGSNPGALDSMEVDKPSCDVDVPVNTEYQKDFEACEEQKDASVTDNLSEDPVVDFSGNKNENLSEPTDPDPDFGVNKNDEDEGGMNTSVAETQLEDQNAVSAEHQNDECKTENLKLESGEGAHQSDECKTENLKLESADNEDKAKENETENLDSVSNEDREAVKEEVCKTENVKLESAANEDKSKENETENLNSVSGEDSESVKEEVTEESKVVNGLKAEVGSGDAILLSGELEALERRRRRKTEIFVGGLDKETKEEDIRKVFGQVGEVTEVRLVLNGKTGKNKGFAFVRFASATDAKNALIKCHIVEICGKQCGTSAVEGNDTLFLGNINKKWKTEDVIKLLKDIGIEKIDKVTVMADPNKIEYNRGFAFLELETYRDAQSAYNKLQNKDFFKKHSKINVAWAEPLIEPDEEEMLKVKSVYAEYLPSSWDEEEVTDYFKRFGEIENVALAKNLRSSKRKDFAFVNYTTREAALACIEAFSRDQLNDEDSKLKVKVSLAKPIPKGKQIKHVPNPTSKEFPQEKRKAPQTFMRHNEPRNKGKGSSSSNYGDARVVDGSRSSTTSELVQLLREQASWRQPEPALPQGPVELDCTYPSPGRKRPFSVMGDDTRYSDPRGYPRSRFGTSYPSENPSAFPQGVGMTALPHHHQQGAGYAPESYYRVEDYPSYVQRRERAPPYPGSNSVYRRY